MMFGIEDLIISINSTLLVESSENNLLRIHSKYLKQGDFSFPLNIKNWYNLIDLKDEDCENVLEYICQEKNLDICLKKFVERSEHWNISLSKSAIIKDRVALYLNRTEALKCALIECYCFTESYGAPYVGFVPNITINGTDSYHFEVKTLTDLRMSILCDVTNNFSFLIRTNNRIYVDLNIACSNNTKKCTMCGKVITKNGKEDVTTTPMEFYKNRSNNLQLLGQHKYGKRIKSSEKNNWMQYFDKLGKAAVTIELMQIKPHKNLKLSLNDVTSSNKGAAFIFYNCARLAALYKKFEEEVKSGKYFELEKIWDIDFSLLKEPEEWELVYVYIMQFPLVIKSCLRNIENGEINPHYLVSFLLKMCSSFSRYYRKVRVLVEPRPHLWPTIQARIYLIQCLQHVLHNSLKILGIKPIQEM